jgi:hypothetical protein
MTEEVTFLINSTLKVGTRLIFELSNLSKKDSINEYNESKIIIQFKNSNFFSLMYRNCKYAGIFIGIPLLNLIENRIKKKINFIRFINGVFIIFEKQENFDKITSLMLMFNDCRKNYTKIFEFEKLVSYLIDRKKKMNY